MTDLERDMEESIKHLRDEVAELKVSLSESVDRAEKAEAQIASYSMHVLVPIDQRDEEEAYAEYLRAALGALLDHYTALVNSGDAGNWDPEGEPVVVGARTALASKSGPSQVSEYDAKLAAVMEGQELLKAQTVRIRHAALGGDIPDNRDTEEIVRQLRGSLETLAKLHGAKLPQSGHAQRQGSDGPEA